MSKIFIKDEGGKFAKVEIDEALLAFVNKMTPPALTSREISDRMGIPYTTIHHRLKRMSEEGLIKCSEDGTYKPGRPSLLWEKV